MPSLTGSVRLWITSAVLLGAAVLLHTANHGEPAVTRQPLADLSYTLGDGAWKGEDRPLQARVVQAVRVTDYTNRVYVGTTGSAVQLYVGYYSTQRTGDTIHSPKNCLPGAGWEPIRSGYTDITLQDGKTVVVNEYVVQKDQDRELVFYWYQGRGRVTASEYAGKFWMVNDAIVRGRTDGALVRLVTPINGDEAAARARLTGFAQNLFPQLGPLIPN